MLPGFRRPLALILAFSLAACGKALSGDHPVTTAEQAVELARTALIGAPESASPLRAVRAGDTWNVSAPPGPAGAVTVYVSARTGRAVIYTDEGTRRVTAP